MHRHRLLRINAPFSHAELTAARLDGHVVELGDAYLPADRIETTGLRASSLAALLPRLGGAALAGASAAWVHGAGDAAPLPHEVQRIGRRRIRIPPTPLLVLHDVPAGEADVVHVDGVPVVSPERTLLDLLRRGPGGASSRWASSLALTDPALVLAVSERLARLPNGPGRRRAKEGLARIERATSSAQDEVTR